MPSLTAPSLRGGISGRIQRVRERRPLADHAVRAFQHYLDVNGNMQAGAVTYFAFLSFFPILALGFFVIGYVSQVFPDAQENLEQAVMEVFPGIIGDEEGQIRLEDIQSAAGALGLFGLFGVLYAGLGWLSSMRRALLVMFEEPRAQRPGFVGGMLRDLVSLVLVGVVLVVSVGVTGVVSHYSEEVLDLIGVDVGLSPLLEALTVVLGLLSSMVLFYGLVQLLARPGIPSRSLWSGALLGAIGFEVLKRVSSFLLAITQGRPAFQAFGIALILLVWINYFSRVVMYSAAWSHTSRAARAVREEAHQEHAVRDAASPTTHPGRRSAAHEPAAPAAFVAGAAAMLGAVALARKTVKKAATERRTE